MSKPIWIVGDWATGRMLHEIPSPAAGTTFSGDLRGSSATLVLDPREPSHRRLREHLRADMTRLLDQWNIIEAKAGNPGLPYEFNLKVKLANPNAPKEGEEAAAGGATAPAAAPAAGGAAS